LVDKLKGEKITINIGQSACLYLVCLFFFPFLLLGALKVKNSLEGNIYIVCKDLLGKIINGNVVGVFCSGLLEVDAIYGNETRLESSNNVTVGLFKGNLQVYSAFLFVIYILLLYIFRERLTKVVHELVELMGLLYYQIIMVTLTFRLIP
jgi:hypothetical protein